MKKSYKFYRINYQISAPKLRLLDEKGKQIGIKDKQEALRIAQTEGKDLVEIAGKADPPVVKVIDFKKFKYLEAKQEREAKKKTKKVTIKEIRLSPFMGDHDFKTRMRQGEEFLKGGNQLKISIPFRGRAITRKEFGFALIKKAIEYLKDFSKVQREPYLEGRVLVAMLTSSKN